MPVYGTARISLMASSNEIVSMPICFQNELDTFLKEAVNLFPIYLDGFSLFHMKTQTTRKYAVGVLTSKIQRPG